MPTEEYEAYMKKQEAAFKTEVTTVVQEPKVGDVPPVVVTTMQQMTTTIISGQVCTSDQSLMETVTVCIGYLSSWPNVATGALGQT